MDDIDQWWVDMLFAQVHAVPLRLRRHCEWLIDTEAWAIILRIADSSMADRVTTLVGAGYTPAAALTAVGATSRTLFGYPVRHSDIPCGALLIPMENA